MRGSSPAILLLLAYQPVEATLRIVHASARSQNSSVVVISHWNHASSWKQDCAPLVKSLERHQLEFILAYFDMNGPSPLSAVRRHACEATRCKKQAINMMNKAILINETIAAGLVDPSTLLISADCTDTLNVCSKAELLRRHRSFGAPIVGSSECSWWPTDIIRQQAYVQHRFSNPYPRSPTSRRYANGGLLSARASDFTRFFDAWRVEWAVPGKQWDWCCSTSTRYVHPPYPLQAALTAPQRRCDDDQYCLHIYMLSGLASGLRPASAAFRAEGNVSATGSPFWLAENVTALSTATLAPGLQLDYYATLFLTLYSVNEVRFNETTIAAEIGGQACPRRKLSSVEGNKTPVDMLWSRACFIHGAGPGKKMFRKISSVMGFR